MSDSETDTAGHLSAPSTVDAASAPGAVECDCAAEVQAFAEELALAAGDGRPDVTGIAPAILVLLAWWLYKKQKKKPPPQPNPNPDPPTPGG